jgi:hypothetical protein
MCSIHRDRALISPPGGRRGRGRRTGAFLERGEQRPKGRLSFESILNLLGDAAAASHHLREGSGVERHPPDSGPSNSRQIGARLLDQDRGRQLLIAVIGARSPAQPRCRRARSLRQDPSTPLSPIRVGKLM